MSQRERKGELALLFGAVLLAPGKTTQGLVAYQLGVHTDQVEASPLSASNTGTPPNVIFQARETRGAHLHHVPRKWRPSKSPAAGPHGRAGFAC